MKKALIWITAMLLVALLCGCSVSPDMMTAPEESEIPVSQTEESPAPESSSEIAEESGISFSDSESAPAEQTENSEGAADTATTESSAPATTTPAPKQTAPAANEPTKPPEQPADAPQQPAETPKPQETPQATTPEPTPAPAEPPQTFDVSQYVSYAKQYGQEIGLTLDSTATACWDNPLIASSSSTTLERDIRDMLDWYKADGNEHFWVWTQSRSDGKFDLYIGYA